MCWFAGCGPGLSPELRSSQPLTSSTVCMENSRMNCSTGVWLFEVRTREQRPGPGSRSVQLLCFGTSQDGRHRSLFFLLSLQPLGKPLLMLFLLPLFSLQLLEALWSATGHGHTPIGKGRRQTTVGQESVWGAPGLGRTLACVVRGATSASRVRVRRRRHPIRHGPRRNPIRHSAWGALHSP